MLIEPIPSAYLAQELFVSVAKIYIVAELLARSPDFTIVKSNSPHSAMAQSFSPGEQFLEPPMKDFETVVVTIGGIIMKSGLAGVGAMLGASALSEAHEVMVEQLTEKLGKYQTKTTKTTKTMVHQIQIQIRRYYSTNVTKVKTIMQLMLALKL